VSKFSRIINISNLDIKAKDRPLPNSTITADCVATTFVLLDQKAVAAAAATAAAARGAAPPAAAKK
jgi:Tfp pilus assembly protein PilO